MASVGSAAAGAPAGEVVAPQQKAKKKRLRVYVPQPMLEGALTALFFASLVYIARSFGQEDLTTFVAAIAGTTVAVFVVKYLSRSIGRAINGMLRWRPLSKRVNSDKFGEQVWQLVVHATLACVDWAVLEGEPWYDDVSTVWTPDPLKQVHKPSLRLMVMMQLGVWVYTLIIHRWFDYPRRKDFVVMYIHHVITIWVVALGAANGFHRISVVILAVHDTSDILIDMLKICNLLGVDGAKAFFLTETVFVANLIVWVYYRLWIYPTRILYSVYIDFHALAPPLDKPFPGEPWRDPLGCFDINQYLAGVVLLTALQLLHVLWTYILLRIAYRLVFLGQEGHSAGAAEYEGNSDTDSLSDGESRSNKKLKET